MTFDLFSNRMKRLRGDVPSVLAYDLPEKLRVQIVHAWRAVSRSQKFWGQAVQTLIEDRGVLYAWQMLQRGHMVGGDEATLSAYFLNERDVALSLDVVELAFQGVDTGVTAKLNARFREAGVGYQFDGGQIIRVDNTFLHAEVVEPALVLLATPGFEGADAEFRTAHEHHRHSRQKECIVEAGKAFESTMKAIAGRRGWEVPPGATASKLIDLMFKQELLPAYFETAFASLRQLMVSGVPTVRNKQGAHGQGAEVVEVPAYLAAYTLHVTAANIVMLVEAERAGAGAS